MVGYFREFHKRNKYLGITNIANTNTKTLTQKFIENYNIIEKKYGESHEDKETIYNEAMELLKREKEMKQDIISNSTPITNIDDNKSTSNKVNISKIFE